MKIEFQPIGLIHTPLTKAKGMPIQPAVAASVKGTVAVFEEYRTGLKDLDGFSHIVLLYLFHRSQGFDLQVLPYLDSKILWLIATSAPKRPNPFVQLDKIEAGVPHIQNVDILGGTPLLNIKPYVPEFDAQAKVRTGWLAKARKTVLNRKSDDRFK